MQGREWAWERRMHIFSFVEECNANASRAMSHPSFFTVVIVQDVSHQGVLRNRDKLGSQERHERQTVASSRGLDFPSASILEQ